MLRPLEQRHGLDCWDDSRIRATMVWREEIKKALASAQVALLMVSADFLASDFVTREELPELFHAAKKEGLRILWVPLRPCLWEEIPEIEEYKAVIPAEITLARMAEVEQEEAFVQIAKEIMRIFREEAAREPAERSRQPRKISVYKASIGSQGKDAQGEERWDIQKDQLTLKVFEEALGEGVPLEMVEIPAGSFLMGSPPGEEGRDVYQNFPEDLKKALAVEGVDEEAQRRVSVPGFLMGRFPITQAQWRKVAQWKPREGEIWSRDLIPDPSRFQGQEARLLKGEDNTDQRPVEPVSWHEAMEFCSRLSQRIGRTYTLPSEAQWEYACRAGTTTPFHFGETITTDLANYDGNTVYGDGPKGESREQTTPVGSFPANAWGLQDMHGNVWEWCLDTWHDSYEGAPTDGSTWLEAAAEVPEDERERRVLRGGSWHDLPRRCRSACWGCSHPIIRSNDHVGFRVCALLPGLPSLP